MPARPVTTVQMLPRSATVPEPAPDHPRRRRTGRRRITGEALGRGELWLLLLMSAWSVLVLGAMLVRAHHAGLIFLGADSRAPGDQLQYLAWIQESSRHLLVANLYGFGSPEGVFVHPMWLVSGLLLAVGAAPAVALLVWKPVAVVLLFLAVRAFVRRLTAPGWPRRLAMLLALFYYPPVQAFVAQTGLGVTRRHVESSLRNDLLPVFQLWGYLPAAIAIAAIPFTLLAIERLLDRSRRAPGRGGIWYGGWAGLAALTASWLHPWQGETLALVIVGLIAWDKLRPRNLALLAPLVAALAPLAYYFVLSRADPSWGIASRQADFLTGSELPVVALGLAPLGVPAFLGARGGAVDAQERMLRLWPLAALVVYLGLRPPYPLHAFAGITVPLAVLAVRWFTRLGPKLGRGRPWLAATAILALVGSCLPFAVQTVAKVDHGSLDLTLLKAGDYRALRYISRARGSGGVFTTADVGYAVPGVTGRSTWVGHPVWTPRAGPRYVLTTALFSGRLAPVRAQAVLAAVDARFVLVPCGSQANLDVPLAGLRYRSHRFGCAAVYQR